MSTPLPPAALGTGHPVSSSSRLTGDAVWLLTLASGPTLLLAVLTAGTQFAGVTWSPAVAHGYAWVPSAAALLQLLWLIRLVTRRLSAPGRSPRHRAVPAAALTPLSALVLTGPVLQMTMTFTTALMVRTVLLAWLAYEVCLRHSIPLSRPVAGGDRLLRWHTAFRQTERVYFYCALGTVSTSIAVVVLRWLGPSWLPVMRTDQTSAIGVDSRTDLLLELPWTVVMEGVVIGTVGLLLHAAQRPARQIYTLIAVVEVVLHVYFGLPAVLMAVYAVLCARFYLHQHRLGPLLLGHTLFDLLGILVSTWSLVQRLPLLLVLLLVYGAVERWLARSPGRRTAAAPSPHGLHPDDKAHAASTSTDPTKQDAS